MNGSTALKFTRIDVGQSGLAHSGRHADAIRLRLGSCGETVVLAHSIGIRPSMMDTNSLSQADTSKWYGRVVKATKPKQIKVEWF